MVWKRIPQQDEVQSPHTKKGPLHRFLCFPMHALILSERIRSQVLILRPLLTYWWMAHLLTMTIRLIVS